MFDAIPESAPSCKAPQSRENVARFAELRHVGKNNVWQKASQYAFRTNPEANLKSEAHFLSNLISVAFFLAYTQGFI